MKTKALLQRSFCVTTTLISIVSAIYFLLIKDKDRPCYISVITQPPPFPYQPEKATPDGSNDRLGRAAYELSKTYIGKMSSPASFYTYPNYRSEMFQPLGNRLYQITSRFDVDSPLNGHMQMSYAIRFYLAEDDHLRFAGQEVRREQMQVLVPPAR